MMLRAIPTTAPRSDRDAGAALRLRVATGLAALSVLAAALLCAGAPALAAGPLEVTADPPTSVLPGCATLHGAVNANGETVASCEFQYGRAEVREFISEVPCLPSPGTGSAPEAVEVGVSELQRDKAYRYRLRVFNAEGERFLSPEELFVTPPTVVGSALASGITSFAATLTGVVGSGEVTPTYHFAYGTSSAYGSSAPSPDADVATGGLQSVTEVLTGLQPDTTYHFALVVSNFGGAATVGPDETFTTRPLVPPAVSTGGVEAVGQDVATLTGVVDPEGLDTTYSFQYGTSSAYGSVWPSAPAHAGSVSGSEVTAVALENLQPETIYHYRLVASNEDGTTYGSDQTFATAPRLVSVIQEAPVSAPPLGVVSGPKVSKKGASKPKKHGKKKGAGHRKARGRAGRGKKR